MTRRDRVAATFAASNAVREAGGYVLDFNQLGGASVCLLFVMPVASLCDALRQESIDVVSSRVVTPPNSDRIEGTMQIDFVVRSGEDKRVTVPPVPG